MENTRVSYWFKEHGLKARRVLVDFNNSIVTLLYERSVISRETLTDR